MRRRSRVAPPRRLCPTRNPRRSGRPSRSRSRAARADDVATGGRRRARGAVTTVPHPRRMPPAKRSMVPVIRTRRRGRVRPLEQIPVWHGFETIAAPGGPDMGEQAEPETGIDALLAGLNGEQRKAVTHGEGPLLVVAGAGTGKTQVITRRIAWLIATRRARPSEILALTFTDQAADEMQVRVDQLVPYGHNDAAIATFHAFGD